MKNTNKNQKQIRKHKPKRESKCKIKCKRIYKNNCNRKLDEILSTSPQKVKMDNI